MKRLLVGCLILSFLGLQVMGCATMTETEKGALTGAIAGGILGALLGGKRGAIAGAFAGTVVGAVIGNYYDRQIASRADAAKRHAYRAQEQGLEIEEAAVKPENIAPGSNVEVAVVYTVLAPNPKQQVKVTEVRTLANGNTMFELAKRDIARAQGTHVSSLRFTMPKDIAKGDYTLITTISDGVQTKTAKSDIKIT
jgi:hypothetical protein